MTNSCMGQAVTWQGRGLSKEIQSVLGKHVENRDREKKSYVCDPVRGCAGRGNSGKEKDTVPLRE